MDASFEKALFLIPLESSVDHTHIQNVIKILLTENMLVGEFLGCHLVLK